VSGRRPLVVAIAGCALGAALILLSSGRVWARVVVALPAAGRAHLAAPGHAVAPSLPALGIALLALAAAILAASGALRRIVGVVIVLVGAIAIGVSVTAPGDVDTTLEHREVGAAGIPVHAAANGWWVLALVGAILCTAAGALTVFRSRQWSQLGAKYDAPGAQQSTASADTTTQTWDALDRGEDPTA